MKEQNEEKNLEVSGVIAKTEQFVEKNKKTITIVAGAIVVVALAIWAYVGRHKYLITLIVGILLVGMEQVQVMLYFI